MKELEKEREKREKELEKQREKLER